MADSVSTEVSTRPRKIPKLEKSGDKSKKPGAYSRLRMGDPESDDFIRQYVLFHYDFCRTEGFGIDWSKFDFLFAQCFPCDGAPRFAMNHTNEEEVEEVAGRAIAKYNAENGTNIVFVKFIEANFSITSYMQFWITFWAKDMSSPTPETKIYQTHTREREKFLVPIFRVKPTEEEMEAAQIDVAPPHSLRFHCFKPYVEFSVAGPEDDRVPGTPFAFKRTPPSPPRFPPIKMVTVWNPPQRMQ